MGFITTNFTITNELNDYSFQECGIIGQLRDLK